MDYNPFLSPEGIGSINGGGGGWIEDSRRVENIRYQTRPAALSAFESRLADDMMQLFSEGVEALEDIVAGLNAAGSLDPQGRPWTQESFTAQIAKAGDALFSKSEGAQDDA